MAKARDKAKVEKAVQDVERWVLAPLRHERFHSVDEINAAMRPLLAALNAREMREYGASRDELFERLDRPALRPLPVVPFACGIYERQRVGLDYHIRVGEHWYSVPYQLARIQVWVKLTDKLVEVLHDNQRVAVHVRSHERGKTTLPEHMPPHHQAVCNRSVEAFLAWARGVGAETEALTYTILSAPGHYELGFRSILGLQRLEKQYGSSRLECAAHVANERHIASARFVRDTLEAQLRSAAAAADAALPQHANIRGGNYYH